MVYKTGNSRRVFKLKLRLETLIAFKQETL